MKTYRVIVERKDGSIVERECADLDAVIEFAYENVRDGKARCTYTLTPRGEVIDALPYEIIQHYGEGLE